MNRYGYGACGLRAALLLPGPGLTVGLAAAVIVLMAAPTWAGPNEKRSGGALDRTTRDVGSKVGVPPGPNAAARRPKDDGCSPRNPPKEKDGEYGTYGDRRARRAAPAAGTAAAAAAAPAVGLDGAIDLGLHSVQNSDGAGTASLRFGMGGYGMAIDAAHYREQAAAIDGTDTVYMTLWSITGRGRVVDMGSTSVWLQAGLSGAASNQFEALNGFVVGTRVEQSLTGRFDVYGVARYFMLSEGMRARELRAGARAYFVTVGYRNFAFADTGELLHGPEAGVSFDF